ncbi:parvulin-like peptidyl-prolyl isomerase [Nostoc sp. PCC 7524]|uniref:peptidylprolyl isomerase n=1 Tax=Nostoc sp. (strain ATCC 29411 / PCC 7524) TaxID=28072 RepID=UPI00029F39C7|nr:peptidylprolyl isomerase [Nostoc sp. PCC 7524]AFY48962.1 parvulin-like peptidyl-prolyl isomerase [Nostoc sp. PCC 7524]
MVQTIKITQEDIIEQIRISCKIPEITKEIISRKIIENTARELGVQVEVEELQKTADQLRVANKLTSADATWAWLEKHNLSLDEFEKIVYISLISGKLADHLFADKVEPYFFEHQLDYTAVVMYEVILDDEDLAWELFYAVKEGEMSFYDVAHKYVKATELRRSGGYRGILKRKDLKPEISAAVFAVHPPQILKPITGSQGFHLILVEEIIQAQLDTKLRHQIMFELFTEWLKHQTGKIEIDTYFQSIDHTS